METCLNTDELNEAISSLEMSLKISECISDDIYQWKWFIISFHNALQATMVLALRGTNNFLVVKEKCLGEILSAYKENTPMPKEELEFFLSLYKKIKGELMLFYVHSQSFKSKAHHDAAMKKINTLRNGFIHFVPKSWSIDVQNLPNICLAGVDIIDFLFFESGNIYFTDNKQQELIQNTLSSTKHNLELLQIKYDESCS